MAEQRWNPGFDAGRKYELVAVTAAKKTESGTYDPDTAVDVLSADGTGFDKTTGSLKWTAPEEGNWSVFWFYRQTSNHTLMFLTPSQYVIDHMSAEGTKAVIDNWEKAFDSDAELKSLYEENGGSLFGDSFELRSNLWTPKMLGEFKTRRGYDLTPYLPAISYDFGSVVFVLNFVCSCVLL